MHLFHVDLCVQQVWSLFLLDVELKEKKKRERKKD